MLTSVIAYVRFIIFIVCFAYTSNVYSTIRYEVSINSEAGPHNPSVHIRVKFKGNETGVTKIKLLSNWAGTQKAYKGVQELNVETQGPSLKSTSKPDIIDLIHEPDQELELSYQLKSIAETQQTVPRTTLPFLDKDFVHAIGYLIWISPILDTPQPQKVELAILNLPKRWIALSSLEKSNKSNIYEGTLRELRSSMFVAGQLEVEGLKFHDGLIKVVRHGAWEFSSDELIMSLEAITRGLQEFVREDFQGTLLVGLFPLPTRQSNSDQHGMGITNGFTLFARHETKLELLEGIITHELIHQWNPKRLGLVDERGARLAWFTEGFSNYYASRLRVKWGMISFSDYVATLNEAVENIARSAYRDSTNEYIAQNFHVAGVGNMMYWRGMILAAKWDAEIRARSSNKHNLDEVMRFLFQYKPQEKDDYFGKKRIDKAMRRVGIDSALADINKYIQHGERITFSNNALGRCVQFIKKHIDAFDFGFDYSASRKSGLITGVRVESHAYTAGIRNGMKLLKATFHPGKAEVPAKILIQDLPDNNRYEIVYTPKSKDPVLAQVSISKLDSQSSDEECFDF